MARVSFVKARLLQGDIPSQVHWLPGVSTVDEPIFMPKLLVELYLPLKPPEPRLYVDLLIQNPLAASTSTGRRAEPRRAANEGGKMVVKARIWRTRQRCKRRTSVGHRVERVKAADWSDGHRLHSREEAVIE